VTRIVALALDVPIPVTASVTEDPSTVQLMIEIVPSDELAETDTSAVEVVNQLFWPFGVKETDIVGTTGANPITRYVPVRSETGTLPQTDPPVEEISVAFCQLLP